MLYKLFRPPLLSNHYQALDFYQQALPLWRAVGDLAGEATTLSNIGVVYDALGEKQKALDYYQQSLPLSRGGAIALGKLLLSIILVLSMMIWEKNKRL